jgi:biotin carboxyl carrier protein
MQTLQPVGLAYEMASGANFQRAFSYNYDSLRLRDTPAQELALQRAVRKTAIEGQSVFLDANTVPAEATHGLRPEDAPAPETLPLFNQTPFQQTFVPIPLNQKSVGVIHAWFAPTDANGAHARALLLVHAAAEMEAYLNARRASDISQELSRINTYARFLEDVAGDQDLDSVAWKLVNYAREAVGCERVCLLIDARYGVPLVTGLPPAKHFELQACSGLRRPHPRSEHAEVLKAHAAELLRVAVDGANDGAAPRAAATNSTSAEQASDKNAKANPAAPKPGGEQRPQMRIIFTTRDPAKTATRPDAVNRYFETIAMNWSTVLPLYDRFNHVCGTLLFEGVQNTEKVAPLFMQMRDLAVSGGRALSTALVWHRRRALRGARAVMRWRDSLLAASGRRFLVKYGLPAVVLVALLAFPFSYRIGGDATLRPQRVQSLAALTTARLVEVNVREGDRVKQGQVLCVLDSTDLELQLDTVEKERERAEAEAAYALRQEHNEGHMRVAQLTAQGKERIAAKLRHDIASAVIRAPFDGVVVGPQDLAQRRGQVVRIGETVAEVVDPSKWEVKVSVREQDVPTLVAEAERRRSAQPAGIPGELVLTAFPNQVYSLQLDDPASFAHRLDTTAGKYNFSAVLPLQTPLAADNLTPSEMKTGYTGKAKFSCGRRPLAQILFGDFVRYLKVNFF